MKNYTKTEKNEKPDEHRLSKRLCYLLRYGALQEGLTVHEGGYVDMTDLMGVHMLRHHTEEEVLNAVETSLSHRGTKRFERRDHSGKVFVRAVFMRKFTKNPCHDGTNVHTLLETCLEFVSTNLQMYDLECFPDEYLIKDMIHRLKRKKKLNSSALRQLLVPALEHLDLEGVMLTEGILKLVWTNCPHLKVLSLKDCGYIVTDNVAENIVRKLPELESLSVCECKHLTDRALNSIAKFGKNLLQINICWIRGFTEKGLIDFLLNCPKLQHIDMYDHKVSAESREVITQIAKGRQITVVLKGLTDSDVAPDDPTALLESFGKKY